MQVAFRRLHVRIYSFLFLTRVHFGAFLLEPKLYVVAAKWWILRKRVRARGQFAPLLSKSPLAYEWWATYRRQTLREVPAPHTHGIVALVSACRDETLLDATLRSLQEANLRFLVIDPRAGNTSGRLAEAAEFQAAEWLMPLEAGDLVSLDAAAIYSSWIARADPRCEVLYADDDEIDTRGHFKNPYFKPDWNSELQSHHDIMTGACIVRADGANLIEAFEIENWSQSLVARAVRRGKVVHVPTVLHHRRRRPAAPMRVAPLRTADRLPPVSVIIPTRNRVDLLRTCIKGLGATQYPRMEIIIANNESDDPETLAYLETLAKEGVRVLDQLGPFNYSRINNNAVAAAKGELICLMNNDIEVLSPDWLAIMATQALRPEVGTVGAQLLYPDGRIQHAGVVVGVGNAAGHAHRFLDPEAKGYFRRHALPQYVSAVTAACLVVRKDRFLAAGGLDEENFAVAYNDVDLCLRLNRHGWQSFYEPRAVLIHHESLSRGYDTDPVGAARFAGELAALQRIWRTKEIVDPYHHPMLSRASEQFAIDLSSVTAPVP